MSYEFIVYVILFFLIFEIFVFILINYFRSEFQWLITEKDEYPKFNQVALTKFINSSYDPILG